MLMGTTPQSRERLRILLSKKLRILLDTALALVRSINWNDNRFDQGKARCLALFSEISYYKITEEEYRRPRRAKVVPCETYQRAIVNGVRIDFDTVVRQIDFGDFDIIQTHGFVAIVFYIGSLIIVAVRGTKFLYDWKANLRCGKIAIPINDSSRISFHSGFLKEAQLLTFHLYERIEHRLNNSQIIIAGHSLGGAIAGILFGIGLERHSFWGSSHREINQCYAFAAPRYTEFTTLLRMKNPYNCINDFDIVPRVPPKILGYSNSVYEFDLKGAPYTDIEQSEKSKLRHWLIALITGEFLDNHSMETYRRKIRGSLRPVRIALLRSPATVLKVETTKTVLEVEVIADDDAAGRARDEFDLPGWRETRPNEK
jgi:hypothetical protein